MGAGGGAATWGEKNHFGKHWKSEKLFKTGEKEFENFDKFSNVITTMVKKIEEPTSPHWRGKW